MSQVDHPHVPVMLPRIVELLAPALSGPGAVHVDCTLGMGGHAEAVLTACPEARLVGVDRDADALAYAGERLARFGDRVTLVRAVFDELPEVLADAGVRRVHGVLLDLGLSSLQIDRRDRGFSYSADAALDMRMDDRQSLTAADVLNTYPERDLARVLRSYGEEPQARRIAAEVVRVRTEQPFERSGRLVALLDRVAGQRGPGRRGHAAKRTFQALRIEVNGELDALGRVLPAAIAALAVGGRIAVLAYHSLEDRLVKRALRDASTDSAPRHLPVVPESMRPQLVPLTRGAEIPADAETTENPRAGSARLRAAMRTQEAAA